MGKGQGAKTKEGQSLESGPPRPVSAGQQIKYWEKTVEWLFVKLYIMPKMAAAPLGGNEEAAGDVMLSFLPDDKWLLLEFKGNESGFSSETKKYPIFENEKWKDLDANPDFKQRLSDAFHNLANKVKSDRHAPHFFVYSEPSSVKPQLVKKGGASAVQPDVGTKKEIGTTKGEGLFASLLSFLGFGPNTKEEPNEPSMVKGSVNSKVSRKNKGISAAHTTRLVLLGRDYWGSWFDLAPNNWQFKDSEPFNLRNLRDRGTSQAEFKIYVKMLLAAKNGFVRDDGDGWGFGTVLAISSNGAIASFTVFEFCQQFGIEVEPVAEAVPPSKSGPPASGRLKSNPTMLPAQGASVPSRLQSSSSTNIDSNDGGTSEQPENPTESTSAQSVELTAQPADPLPAAVPTKGQDDSKSPGSTPKMRK